MSVRTFMSAFFQGFTFGSIPGDVEIPGLPKRIFAEQPKSTFEPAIKSDKQSSSKEKPD
jgi:hypothetical protein